MRVFIAVLVLIFSLQSFTKAEDISEFEIEGMSIGDSLLDHFSEEEISKFQFGFKSKEFAYLTIPEQKLETFSEGLILFKPKDKKFKIHSIVGRLYFNNNINKCYKKQKEIIKEISNMFKNAHQEDLETYKYSADKSGKSKVTTINFTLDEGSSVHVGCYNMNKEYLEENDFFPETALLSMSLNSPEYTDFQITR